MRLKLLLLSMLIAIPAMAQDARPPEPITAQNAADLNVMAQIGAALQGKLVWSPDGNILAVGTSDNVLLYRPAESDQPITQLAGSDNITFDQSGAVVTDSGRYDATTGEYLGESIGFSPSGRYTYTSEFDGTQIVVHLRDTQTGAIQELATGHEQLHPTDNFVFSPDEQRLVLIFTAEMPDRNVVNNRLGFQMWNVLDGSLIVADELDRQVFGVARFNADGSLFVISSIMFRATLLEPGGFGPPDVRHYDGRTGELLEQYGARLNAGYPEYGNEVTFSADKRLFVVTIPGDGILIVHDGQTAIRLYATYLGRQLRGWTTNRLKATRDTPLRQEDIERVEKPLQISGVHFSPDNRYLIAQTAEKPEDYIDARVPSMLFVWEVSSLHDRAAPLFQLQMPDDRNVSRYMLTPDGESILALFTYEYREPGHWNGILFRMENGSLIREVDGSCYPVRFFNDSRRIIANCNSAFVIDNLFEAMETIRVESSFSNSSMSANDEMVAYWDGGQVTVLETETFMPTAELNAIPDFLGRITKFDITRGTAVFASNPTQCVSVIPRGDCEIPSPNILITPDEMYQIEFLTTAADDNSQQQLTTMVIRDHASGEIVQNVNPDGLIGLKVFSPDGSRMAITLKRQVEQDQRSHSCEQFLLLYDLTALALRQSAALLTTIRLPDTCSMTDLIGIELSPDNRFIALDERQSATDPHTFIWQVQLIDTNTPSGDDEVVDLERTDLEYVAGSKEAIFTFDSAAIFVVDAPQERDIPVQSRGFNVWSVTSVLERAHRYETFPPTPPMVTLPGASQLILSSDGSVLAVRGPNVVGLWDVSTLMTGETEPLLMLNIEDVQEIGFSLDGALLFARTMNRVLAYGL